MGIAALGHDVASTASSGDAGNTSFRQDKAGLKLIYFPMEIKNRKYFFYRNDNLNLLQMYNIISVIGKIKIYIAVYSCTDAKSHVLSDSTLR